MKNIFDWDDIPSLDGVGAEWAHMPKTPLGRRAFVRVNNQDIPRIFISGNVLVKVVTVKHTVKKGTRYITGIQFVDLEEESAEYFNGLHASKIFRHTPL